MENLRHSVHRCGGKGADVIIMQIYCQVFSSNCLMVQKGRLTCRRLETAASELLQ